MTTLFGGADARAEKARLEAFLDAVPGDYCGWGADGFVAHSKGFAVLLGLSQIAHIQDIQNALRPSDAAMLEGLFAALQDKGESFSLMVDTAEAARTLRLSGKRGRSADGFLQFDIIWADDITAYAQSFDKAQTAKEKAEEERTKLQAALDQVPLPLWMRDSRTALVWCNRAYAKVYDTTQATVIAEQKELPVKAGTKQARLPGKVLAQGALDSGVAESAQAHIILGGNRRLMNVQEIPLAGRSMTLGVAQDITREEDLETEQKRYMTANKELLEQLGTAIGIFDGEERLEFYNSAFAQLWGLEDNYLNAKPKLGDIMEKLREMRRLPEQADFRKYKQGWLNMFTSLLQPTEDMLYLPNGNALRMLVVPHPMGGLMMNFEDVTSRLELESSYNTLIAVQKETLDNLTEGVVVFGGDGRLKLWNPAFARLWNLNPEDLEGGPHITKLADKMKARFPTDEWPRWQKTMVSKTIERTVQGGHIECADGTLIYYSTVPLPDGGVLVTHVDVTDTMKVEKALRDKNAALETAERLKLDFLANVSYQLRTPLSAIMGFNEILQNEYFGPLNDRQREYTSGMHEASEKLLYLIDDILDLSTIEAGYMVLERDNVDVHDMLSSIQDLTQDWARKDKIEVRLESSDALGTALLDERRIKQALLNLVRNAITYTPPGGTITLGAKRAGDKILLSVTDTGPGIADEDRDRIFQPFERAAAADNAQSRGAGLGLSLVKNIVELHAGQMQLQSMAGKGSVFTMILPA